MRRRAKRAAAENSAQPAATPLTAQQLIRNDIDVHAQYSLRRMSLQGGEPAVIANLVFNSVVGGEIEGIYIANQGVPALRAKALETVWWELIPKGATSACVDGPSPRMPLMVFRDALRSNPAGLDLALTNAWNACPNPPNAVSGFPEPSFASRPPAGLVLAAGSVAPAEIKLAVPRYVKQHSKYWCWAAAISSWLGIKQDPERPFQTQYELEAKYGEHPKDGPQGFLKIQFEEGNYQRMLRELKLLPTDTMRCGNLTPTMVAEVLNTDGHFLLLTASGGRPPTSHMYVVSGWLNLHGSGPTLRVMDPARGTNRLLPLKDLAKNGGCKIFH
ncbi:MAG: hypothetical protein KUG77_24250 [Nannocystaceae bacterium]|nr:hypothetical protein [Nannocystaceae bacterium]